MHRIDTAPLRHLSQNVRLRWQRRVLHFRVPAMTSRGALKERVTYIIEATCNHGVGYGECCVMPGLLAEIEPPTLDYWCNQAELNHTAILPAAPAPVRFGIETAVLSALRGGAPRWDTPFTRGESGIPIHCLIWMADADAMLHHIHEGIQRGFTCLKMKVGALPFNQEIDMLREVKRVFPSAEIRVDANGAFHPAEALSKLTALAELGVSSIEQPIGTKQWVHMAELCKHSPLPIALDEELIHAEDMSLLLDSISPAAIVIKPSLHGGLLAAEQWASAATDRGIDWWVNSALESNVGLTALAEWCAYAAPNRMQGLGTGSLFVDDEPGKVSLQGTQLCFN